MRSLRRAGTWLALASTAAGAPGCSAISSIFHADAPERPPGALGAEVASTAPSGLRIVALEAPASPVVALELVVAAGSADDREDAPGVARALDHVLVEGTPLARLVAARGGAIEAWTARDRTTVSVVVPARAFDDTVAALANAMLAPRWSPAAIDRAVGAMVAELRRSRAAIERIAIEELFAAMRPGTPWARAPIGTVEGLGRVRTQDLRAFHAAHWVPSRMTLAIAGAIDAQHAVDAATQAFARAGAGRRGPPEPAARAEPAEAPDDAEARVVVRGDRSGEACVAIGFAIDDASVDELAALELAAGLLARSGDGRVPAALEIGGLSLGGGDATVDVLSGASTWLLWARIDALHAPAAIESALAEVYRLGKIAPGPAELARARAGLRTVEARGREGMQGLAHRLAERAVGPRAAAAWDTASSGRVAPVAVRDAVARLLVPERMVAVAVVPEDRVEAVQSALAEVAARALERAEQHARVGERTTLADGATREVLANGARLVVAPDRRTPLVAVRVALVGGARIENEAVAGASALLAGLMARSARHGAPRDANISAFAGRDTFGLEGSFAPGDFEMGLERLVHGLVRPALDAGSVEGERRALSLARRSALGDPRTRALARAAALLYGTHPYAADAAGTLESLAALDPARLAVFHAQSLAAQRLAVAVAGAVEVEPALARLRDRVGGLPRGAAAPVSGPPDGAVAEERSLVESQYAEIVLALPGVAWSAADRPALDVAAALLDGPEGLLARALDDRGLAAAYFARHVPGALAGHVEIGATVAPENEAAVRAALIAVVGRLRGGAIAARDLDRARGNVSGRSALSADGLGARAAALAFAELAGGGAMDLADAIQRVTIERVRDAARRAWPEGSERVAVAGPAPQTAQAATP